MNLVLFAALTAVCSAAKLDNTYLPPASAKTAGGSPGFLQTPLTRSSDEVPIGLPAGGYTNAAEGVVVDAVIAGTRNSPGVDESGLGGPRTSYGSTASKVGDAAFRDALPGFSQFPSGFDRSLPVDGRPPGLHRILNPEQSEPNKDQNSNILSYENNVDTLNYNYGFETDNGIAVGENGVSHDGVHAQGGYSYKGDDGKVYKVTYTADKEGYKPQGSHLPTPPPIPDEIQKSIEKNAQEEAAGVVDDGSYDAQKYNAEGDYTETNNNKHSDKLDSQFAKQPESSGAVINQNQPTSGFIGSAGHGSYGFAAHKPQTFAGYKPFNSFNNGLSIQPFGHNSQHSSSANVDQSTQGLGSPSNIEQLGQNSQTQSSSKPQFDQSQTSPSSQSSTGSQFTSQGFKPQFGIHSTKPLIGHQPIVSDSSSLPSSQITQESAQTGTQPSLPSETNLHSIGPNQFLQVNQGASTLGNAPVSTQHKDEIQNYQHDSLPGTSTFGKPIISGPGTSSSFASTSQFGNTFGVTNNENLLPSNTVGPSGKPTLIEAPQKPSYATFSAPASVVSQLNPAEKPTGFQYQAPQAHSTPSQSSSSGSYFDSVAPHSSNAQSSASFNVQPQQSFNAHPVQLPLSNKNTQNPSSQGYAQFNTSNQFASHSQPNQGAQLTQTSFGVTNAQPTAVPQTELTNPLESHKESQTGGKYPSPTAPSNLATFNPQTSTSQPTQSHYGIQSSSGTKPSGVTQTSLASSLLSSTTQNTGYNTFGANKPQPTTQLNSGRDEIIKPALHAEKAPHQPQIELTQGGVGDAQYASSTEKPTFGQQNQGISNSYFYNQPSKPFSIPQFRPQGSIFPAAPSNQFNAITEQQVSQSSGDISNLPASVPAHTEKVSGSNQYPNEQTLSPVASTSSVHKESTYSQTSHSGVTQATTSPFSSGSPTPTSQLNNPSGSKPLLQQPINQLNQGQFSSFQTNQQSNSNQLKPSQQPQKPLNNFGFNSNAFQGQSHVQSHDIKPLDSHKELTVPQESNTQIKPTQQYTGEIYEYNKPPQGLPAPSSHVNAISNIPNTQTSTKPQFGQTQSTQTSTHFQTQTLQVQKETTSQLLVQPVKPEISQPSQPSSSNTGIVASTQSEQNSRPQFIQNLKPFSTSSQFSVQPTKPQFGQNPQASYGSQQSLNSQQQTSQTQFSKFDTKPSKPQNTATNFDLTSPIQSQSNVQPEKPELSQTSQDFGSQSSFGQSSPSIQGVVPTTIPQDSSTLLGNQPLKPFESTPSGQSSQSYQSQPTEGSKPQLGTQPIKSQISQNTGSNIGSPYNPVSSTQQQLNQFGTKPFKPFSSTPITTTTSFGVQQTKPQFGQNAKPNYGNTQTSSIVPTSQQQSTKGSHFQLGSQSYKPFGSTHTTSVSSPVVSQFGVEPTKTQFGQTLQPTQSSSSAYASSSSTQEQTSLDSRPQSAYQPYKPYGSASSPFGSSFHSLPIKTQFGQVFQPTQSSAYASSSVSNTQEKNDLGSRPQFGTNPYTPFSNVPSHFGTQPTKTQYGQNLQPTHSSAFASSSAFNTQEHSTPVSHFQFPSQQFKPFGSAQATPVLNPSVSQFGTQSSKTQQQPTHSSAFASSTASNSQEHSTPISQYQFPSQQFKPFGSAQSNPVLSPTVSQFGTQSTKTQQQPTHSSAFASSTASNTQENSGLVSQPQFPSQQFKPFGSVQSTPVLSPTVSQFGTVPSITQQQPTHSSAFASSTTSNTQENSGLVSQPQFPSQQFKPFGSAQSAATQYGNQPAKTQFGQNVQPSHSSAHASSSASNTQEQPSHSHQPSFGAYQYKPFGSAQLTPISTTALPQLGTQPIKTYFGQNLQPAHSSAYASSSNSQGQPGDSRPHFNQAYKPFNAPSINSASKTQFGVQPAPSSSQTAHSFEPQSSVQPLKPSSNTVGSSTQHIQQGSTPQISQTAQTTFGAPSTTVNQASPQTSSSYVSNLHGLKPAQANAEKGEKFDGAREPPRFDDKTGYHY